MSVWIANGNHERSRAEVLAYQGEAKQVSSHRRNKNDADEGTCALILEVESVERTHTINEDTGDNDGVSRCLAEAACDIANEEDRNK